MADNNDSSLSFGIEETMDMGVGNTELIKDLMAPEMSGDADDLSPVEDEKKEEPKRVEPITNSGAKLETKAPKKRRFGRRG